MIQKETVSSRFDSDKTKYYEFHKILEELFPLVHKTRENMFSMAIFFLNGQEGKGGADPSYEPSGRGGGEWQLGA